MSLDKKDLGHIKTIVKEIVDKSEERINKNTAEMVQQSENRVVAIISREVSDLADINRAVIDKVDRVDILEKRLRRVEHKIGIVN